MSRTVAQITAEIHEARAAGDWERHERLYDERRAAEVTADEAAIAPRPAATSPSRTHKIELPTFKATLAIDLDHAGAMRSKIEDGSKRRWACSADFFDRRNGKRYAVYLDHFADGELSVGVYLNGRQLPEKHRADIRAHMVTAYVEAFGLKHVLRGSRSVYLPDLGAARADLEAAQKERAEVAARTVANEARARRVAALQRAAIAIETASADDMAEAMIDAAPDVAAALERYRTACRAAKAAPLEA